MIRKFTVLLVFLLTLSMAKGYPQDNFGGPPREPYTDEMIDIPLDPVSVNSSRPYLMKVPSGEDLTLVFHFNGTSGNGVFTFALFQVENETVPNTPKFSDYGSLIKESRGDINMINKDRIVRTGDKYRNEKMASIFVVKVESGEKIDGIVFEFFYTSDFSVGDLFPKTVVKENESEAMLAIYFEGEGTGQIDFIDFHLLWGLVMRGGEINTSTIKTPWAAVPTIVSFLALPVVRRLRSWMKN